MTCRNHGEVRSGEHMRRARFRPSAVAPPTLDGYGAVPIFQNIYVAGIAEQEEVLPEGIPRRFLRARLGSSDHPRSPPWDGGCGVLRLRGNSSGEAAAVLTALYPRHSLRRPRTPHSVNAHDL